jgi:hypothetical protein
MTVLAEALDDRIARRLGEAPGVRDQVGQVLALIEGGPGLAEGLAAHRSGFPPAEVRLIAEAVALTEDMHLHMAALASAFADPDGGSRVCVPKMAPAILSFVPEVERGRLLAGASPADLRSCGALGALAEHVETARRELASRMEPLGPRFADWLEQANRMASLLYELPSPVRVKRSEPVGSWRQKIEVALASILDRLPHAPVPPPRVMWPRHEWMFDAVHQVIFVPDLDVHGEAVLRAQAELLGVTSPERVRSWVERTLPLLLAHEYGHFWRFESGVSSRDVWFEEWAANRLSVALLRRGNGLSQVREVFDGLEAHGSMMPSDSARTLLASLQSHDVVPDESRTSYGMELSDVAFVQLGLVRWLLDEPLSIEEEIGRCGSGAVAGAFPPAPMWEQMVVDVCEEAIAETYEDPMWRLAIGAAVARGKRTLLDTWLDLGEEAGLGWKDRVERAAACYLYYCHINLTDDMQDGDCDYVPPRLAPLVLVALTNLSEWLRAKAGVSMRANEAGVRSMSRAVAAQYLECTGGIRDEASYLQVGHGIAGDQFATYFTWFLDGTRWAEDAQRYGFVLGNLAHLQIDMMTKDPRFFALPDQARDRVIGRTLKDAAELVNDDGAPEALKRRLEFLLARLHALTGAREPEQGRLS